MATLTDASWLPITKPVVMSEIRFHPLGDAPVPKAYGIARGTFSINFYISYTNE